MKNRILGARLSAVAVAVSGVVVSQWAAAQSQLKEVVVTASRMEQALQTAPIGATVILGDDIRASGMSDANEAVRKLAGVTARSDQNGGREASLDLRGFGDTASSNMVVLIDGVRISQNELASARLSAIAPDMIDRIEVVRGGSSVVWGDGATAGVINVVTKAGFKQGVSGSVQFGLQSHGGRDTQVALNVGTAGARYFVQARGNRTDGMRQNNANSNESINLGAEVGEDNGLKARLGYFKENQRSRWPGTITYAQYVVDPTASTKPLDQGSQNEERTSLLTQYKTGAWLFSLDLARGERRTRGHIDYGFDPYCGGWCGDQDDLRSTKTTQISPRVNYSDTWGQTLVTAVAGFDRLNWSFDAQTYYSGFWGGDEQATQKNRAHYLKADFLFPTKTRLVVGKRQERIEKHDTSNDGFSINTYAQNLPLHAWEIGLNQTLGAGWDAFGRVATSYRVANVDENRYQMAPLRPQTAKDHEIGLRYAVAKNRMGIRVFKQDTVDEIACILYPKAYFCANANLDPVRRRGVELEGQTEINREWTVSGTIQKINAKFSSGVYAGNTPPHVSKLNATARVTYTYSANHQVEMAVQKRGETVLGNDWANACSIKNPARTTYDALYRFRSLGEDAKSGSWTILAGVDNLTNAKSFSWAFTNAACVGPNVYPDVGRVYKVNARYHF